MAYSQFRGKPKKREKDVATEFKAPGGISVENFDNFLRNPDAKFDRGHKPDDYVLSDDVTWGLKVCPNIFLSDSTLMAMCYELTDREYPKHQDFYDRTLIKDVSSSVIAWLIGNEERMTDVLYMALLATSPSRTLPIYLDIPYNLAAILICHYEDMIDKREDTTSTIKTEDFSSGLFQKGQDPKTGPRLLRLEDTLIATKSFTVEEIKQTLDNIVAKPKFKEACETCFTSEIKRFRVCMDYLRSDGKKAWSDFLILHPTQSSTNGALYVDNELQKVASELITEGKITDDEGVLERWKEEMEKTGQLSEAAAEASDSEDDVEGKERPKKIASKSLTRRSVPSKEERHEWFSRIVSERVALSTRVPGKHNHERALIADRISWHLAASDWNGVMSGRRDVTSERAKGGRNWGNQDSVDVLASTPASAEPEVAATEVQKRLLYDLKFCLTSAWGAYNTTEWLTRQIGINTFAFISGIAFRGVNKEYNPTQGNKLRGLRNGFKELYGGGPSGTEMPYLPQPAFDAVKAYTAPRPPLWLRTVRTMIGSLHLGRIAGVHVTPILYPTIGHLMYLEYTMINMWKETCSVLKVGDEDLMRAIKNGATAESLRKIAIWQQTVPNPDDWNTGFPWVGVFARDAEYLGITGNDDLVFLMTKLNPNPTYDSIQGIEVPVESQEWYAQIAHIVVENLAGQAMMRNTVPGYLAYPSDSGVTHETALTMLKQSVSDGRSRMDEMGPMRGFVQDGVFLPRRMMTTSSQAESQDRLKVEEDEMLEL